MSRERQAMQSYRLRRLTVQLLFLLGMGLLAARAVELQVFKHDFLQQQALSRHTRVLEIPAHRGDILDRNGEPLAISTPVASIWANPRELELTPELAAGLSQLIGIGQADLMEKIRANGDKQFIYLKRQLQPEIGEAVVKLGLRGIGVEREYRRFYPKGEVFGHLLGFTNIDDQGQEGLERAYDEWLSGEPGAKRVLREGRGRPIDDLDLIKPAKPGKTLQLSVDARIQYLAYRELKAAVEANQAESGSVVVMDPMTGQVLAMVNQPRFNPNVRSQLRGRLYRNRAITDVFEPGSAVKPFTIACAIETGQFEPSSKIDTSPGLMRVSGFPIRDSHNLGVIDLTTLIAKSSNVGASKVAMQLAPADLWNVFHQVGFGQTTGSGFPAEASGVLRDYTQWYPLDQATLAFGYGFSVTALQLAEAYSVLAANGVYRPVSFVLNDQQEQAQEVLSAGTTQKVRKMMQRVVQPQGTGYRAAIEGYSVAGKTGTARKIVGGAYSEDHYTAVFAGMVPADNPRLVAVVVIHSPSAGHFYGGDVAAPVFSKLMSAALRLLNIAPDALEARAVSPRRGGAI